MTEETRARMALYRELTSIQHRNIGPAVGRLKDALAEDPDFTSRALVYMALNSAIRDQQDSAITALLTAPNTDPDYPNYREAGRCLLLGDAAYPNIVPAEPPVNGLEPFRIFRALEFAASRFKVMSGREEMARYQTRKIAEAAIAGVASRNQKQKDALTVEIDTNISIPTRLLRSVASDYLAYLQSDTTRLDVVATLNRRAMKRAYKAWHIPTSDFAQAVLFDKVPPPGSKSAAIKEIAATDDIGEKAALVMKNKIPYRIAASLMGKSTEAGIALVGVMSPTEALNSRSWLERSGVLNIPAVKEVYLEKIAKATKSAASASHRKSAKGTDQEVEAAIAVAKDEAVAKEAKIERDVLLLVDKSTSMESAFEVAKEIGSRIAPACEGDLMTVAFNDYAAVVDVKGTSFSAWEKAFRPIRASGWTSAGVGLKYAIDKGFTPQEVVIITDGGENTDPYFSVVLEGMPEMSDIHVTVIGLENQRVVNNFSSGIQAIGSRVDTFFMTGDDYQIFDQVTSLLSGPGQVPLVQRIMDTQLPHRVLV